MRNWFHDTVETRLADAVGGPARLHVIVVPLKHSFHISNTQIGPLFILSGLIGALATLPCGALADHVNRTRSCGSPSLRVR
jgi:hypothetical protein